MLKRVALVFLFASSSVAWADSWAPATKETYTSADKSAQLTVTPRDLKSSLAYFEDKVAGKELAGAPAGDKTTSATALHEVRTSGRWEKAWAGPLANEVAPVSVVVANKGLGFATFDNWHSMGFGSDVIVIYGRDGTLIRKLGLSDLFPEWYVAALPRSVSSIHWRGDPRISADGSELIVPVVQPSEDSSLSSESKTLDLSIRMSDGDPVGLERPEWKAALVRAAATALEKCRADRDYIAGWNSPTAAPTEWDEPSWHAYLRELYYRTAPIVDGEFPAALGTTVLRPPSAADFKPSVGWLKEDLTEKTNIPDFDVRAIGSPDYERLTQEIEKIAPAIRPNQLKGVELIIVIDAPRTDRVRAALARTGAKLRIVDPLQKVSQRPERIRNSDVTELPVCQVPPSLTSSR